MKILGLPNHAVQSYATLDASSFAGLFPPQFEPELVLNEEPSERTRFTLLDPYHTQLALGTSGLLSLFHGFAIINHNINDGGQFRILGSILGPSLHLPTRAAPTSISNATNISGSVSDVDEAIDTPDGLSITPTVTSDSWGFTCDFPTPGGTLGSIADALCFVVRARRAFSGAGATAPQTYPSLSIKLTEGGSLIRSLGYRAVTETAAGGQILIFPFSKSELADPTGAGIQAEIDGSVGLSASGHQYIALETVSFYWESGFAGFDSGWITVDNGDDRPAPLQPSRSSHYFPDTAWTALDGITLLIRSDQTRHDPPKTQGSVIPVGAIAPAKTVIDIGVFCAGEGITLGRGIKKGSGPLAGPETVAFDSSTIAGQPYGADSYRFRSTDPIEVLVTRDEALFLQDQLAYRRGQFGAFYVVLEPDIATYYQLMSSFWARLKSLSRPHPLGRYRADGQMLHSMEVQFTERL